MGGKSADMAPRQPLDAPVLWLAPAHGISSVDADFRSADDSCSPRVANVDLVVGNGITGGELLSPVFYRRRLSLVRAEPRLRDQAFPPSTHLVARPVVVVGHAPRLLGIRAAGWVRVCDVVSDWLNQRGRSPSP